jgi:hypothetical protein
LKVGRLVVLLLVALDVKALRSGGGGVFDGDVSRFERQRQQDRVLPLLPLTPLNRYCSFLFG